MVHNPSRSRPCRPIIILDDQISSLGTRQRPLIFAATGTDETSKKISEQGDNCRGISAARVAERHRAISRVGVNYHGYKPGPGNPGNHFVPLWLPRIAMPAGPVFTFSISSTS